MPLLRPACFAILIAASLAGADADLILHNGKILTVDSRFSIQQAVAVKDGRVAATGSSSAVLAAERGARTNVIDLKGRTVVPGLIDAHVHALGAGLSEFRTPLPPLDSFGAIQNYIREKARSTPKGNWIVVPRTFPTRLKELRMPTREVLDVSPDHPVMFDASYVWVVNTRALQVSGITRDTAPPPGGEIVKDAKGEPNGILKNAGSLLIGLDRRGERFTEEEQLLALEGMLRRYLEAGLTAVGDRAVSAQEIGLFEKLKSQGRLPLRVVLTWRLGSAPPAEELANTIRNSRYSPNSGDDWLRVGTFKLTLDGGMTIGTAYQRRPYGSFGRQLYGMTNPDDRGQLFIAPAKLKAILEAAHGQGWQMTAHSQGGGAIDALLDAFEELNRTKPIAPSRSHLMHASFQSPEAIARTARLGVLADVQASWLYYDGPALQKVFPGQGMRYFFPLRTYLNSGVILAGGSDHMVGHDKNLAVNPYNPFFSMWVAVTRKTSAGQVLFPEERINREEALKMYTIWPAHLQFAEKSRGSLEAGKYADMVVIDRDYLTCPEDQIRRIEPVAVFIEGRRVRGNL